MCRRLLLLSCVLLFRANLALGGLTAQTVIILSGQQGFVLSISDQGQATVTKADHVIRLDSPPPVPPPQDDLKAIAASWRQVVTDYPQRDRHAQSLAVVYGQLAKMAKDGAIKDLPTLKEATKRTIQILLAEDLTKWQAWGQAIEAKLDALAQSGGWSKASDAAGAYDAIAEGLSVGQTEAIDPNLLRLILEIIRLVLEFLQNRPVGVLP